MTLLPRHSSPTNLKQQHHEQQRAHSNRTQIPFVARWLCTLIAMVIIRSSTVLYWMALEDHLASVEHVVEHLQVTTSREALSRDRKQISRPPVVVNAPPIKNDDSITYQMQHAQSIHPPPNKEWEHQQVGPTSRVVITNVLTNPLGVELVTRFVESYNVSDIFGMSGQTVHSEVSSRLVYVFQRFPSFHLFRISNHIDLNDMRKILHHVNPTHIIHLEDSAFESEGHASDIFRHRRSVEYLETLAKGTIQYQRRRGSKAAIHIIHVTESIPTERMMDNTFHNFFPRMHSMLRSLYGIQTWQINLPSLVGPFAEARELSDIILKNKSSDSIAAESVIFVTDAVNRILRFLTTPKVNDRARNATSPTADEASVPVTVHIGGESSIQDVQLSLRSWNYELQHPFESSSEVIATNSTSMADIHALNQAVKRKLNDGEHEGISLTQKLRHNLFPCTSECAGAYGCRSSVFDENTIQISKNVTSTCRFVAYISDFSTRTAGLEELSNGIKTVPWPRQSLCLVAFVSKHSILVKSLLGDRQGEHNSHNGRLVHNGWTLVWPNESPVGDQMLEADLLLPKIAPGNLFSQQIDKALYYEPSLFSSFPPLPVIWYLMAKRLDAPSKPAKWMRAPKTKDDDGGYAPAARVRQHAAPPRHVALFVHIYNDFASLQHGKEGRFDRMVKYVLQQRNADGAWPRRQVQYYQELWELSNRKLDFGLLDTSLLIHNIKSNRSRRLRCEWYEKHLSWSNTASTTTNGSNQHEPHHNLEDLSLSMIRAEWKLNGRLEKYEDIRNEGWGERLLGARSEDDDYFLRLHRSLKHRKEFGGEWKIKESSEY